MILDKGQLLETEQMFCDTGEQWPVIIPEEKIRQAALGTKLMCLAGLEFDCINPYDSASRINKMIMPEFITQGVLCFLYLITGHWFMSLLSVPYLYYNVRVSSPSDAAVL